MAEKDPTYLLERRQRSGRDVTKTTTVCHSAIIDSWGRHKDPRYQAGKISAELWTRTEAKTWTARKDIIKRDRLRNDLYCVEWDVKPYYTIPLRERRSACGHKKLGNHGRQCVQQRRVRRLATQWSVDVVYRLSACSMYTVSTCNTPQGKTPLRDTFTTRTSAGKTW